MDTIQCLLRSYCDDSIGRDASRASEEDLFGRLNERTNDLERLQESYVDIGDRCNDLQDEVRIVVLFDMYMYV